MKLEKIYGEIIKAKVKDKIGLCWGLYDENTIGITTDGLVMYFIPKDLFFLDTDKLGAPMDLEKFRPPLDAKQIMPTGEMREIDFYNKKTTCVKIGEKWFNKDLLKNFTPTEYQDNKKEGYTPIYLYEGSKLVGLVCPIRMRQDEI